MDGLIHDVRYAIRSLRKSPGFSVVAVLTLALGIGSTTAVFTIVDQTILRLPPFLYANRLVVVLDTNRATGGGGSSLTPEKIAGWQQSPVFERFEGYSPRQVDLRGDSEPERAMGAIVTTGLFSMLGVRPALGRAFENEDTYERVVVISENLWRRRFGASEVIGRTLHLDDEPHTIIGVMPRSFHLMASAGPNADVFWLPVDVAHPLPEYAVPQFYGLGRLLPNLTLDAVQQRANLLADEYQRAHPIPRSWDVLIRPKLVSSVSGSSRTALLVLLAAVAFVLLIACANVANLALARMLGRERDIAIRSAMGASRIRLIQQTLIESVVLSGVGAVGGVVLAIVGVRTAVALGPTNLAFLKTTSIEIDGRILVAVTFLAMIVGVLVGLVPAVRGSGFDFQRGLRLTAAASRSTSMSNVAVVTEVASALMLVVAAGLMARTLVRLHSIETGFDARNLMSVPLRLSSSQYPTPLARFLVMEDFVRSLRLSPHVLAVTASSYAVPPLTAAISWGVEGERSATGVNERALFARNTVASNYFQTLAAPLIDGRTFVDSDETAVIISRSTARYFWQDGSALGHRLRFSAKEPWHDVVGVVGDVETRMGDQRLPMQVYLPLLRPRAATDQTPATGRRVYYQYVLTVRSDDPDAVRTTITVQLQAVAPNQPIDNISSVEQVWNDVFGLQRFTLIVMAVFAMIALALAAAGVLAVLSQFVAGRTREIGIRVALGATPTEVVQLVVGRGILLIGVGIGSGLAGALAGSRILTSLLYKTGPRDSVSMAGAVLVLFVVGCVACWFPARRAARIDPIMALRTE